MIQSRPAFAPDPELRFIAQLVDTDYRVGVVARWLRLWILVCWANLLLIADAGLAWSLLRDPSPVALGGLPAINAAIGIVVALLARTIGETSSGRRATRRAGDRGGGSSPVAGDTTKRSTQTYSFMSWR